MLGNVASFVGTLNMLEGVVVDPATGAIRIGETTIFAFGMVDSARAGNTRTLALRPEALRLGSPARGANTMRVVVEDVAFLGAVVRLKVRLGDRAMLIDTFNAGGASLRRQGTRDRLQPLDVE